jgi:predicted nucleic-acid-binding protein
VVRRAVRLYRSGVDFADALVAESNLDHACRSTYTFDRSPAKKLSNMELLR